MVDEQDMKTGQGEQQGAPQTGVSQPTPQSGEQQPVQADSQPASGQEAVQEQVAGSEVVGDDTGGGGRKKKLGMIIAVVLILALGTVTVGFYFGRRVQQAKKVERPRPVAELTPVPSDEDALTAQYEKLSSSDEIADIEADLRATAFEGIDAELMDIDKEFDSE